MKDFFEDLLIYVSGTVIVLLMCILYVVCRICGIHMEDDF